MNLPFVICTPARTGSTTLMKLVNCHPGIKCLFEPFNTGNVSQLASRLQVVQQTHGLAAAVGTLWTVCNGFKHVWHNDGWPFVSEPELNYQILLLPGVSIVLLSRRNLLRRAISVQISDQMKVWVPWNDEQRRKVKEHVRGSWILADCGRKWRATRWSSAAGPRETRRLGQGVDGSVLRGCFWDGAEHGAAGRDGTGHF